MKSKFIGSILAALLVAISAQPALCGRAEDCEALVEKAVAFMQEKGTDYASKVFSTSRGPFVNRELYVFAVSLDDVLLAHPYRKDLIGSNVADYQDSRGFPLFAEFNRVAKNGGSGWVDYWWTRPGESGDFQKRSFVRRVPGTEVYVGAGYYVEREAQTSKSATHVTRKE